jgi:dipeptidyl aminopeptidase/acylaminoacyl peptidase
VLIHGDEDGDVPLSQSETYVAAATAALDPASLSIYAGGHFEHLDPTTEAVDLLRQALAEGA